MQCSGTVLSHPESIFLREPCVHLSGSLCSGCKLEFHFHSVNRHGLTCRGDNIRRRYIRCGTAGLPHSDTYAERACLAAVKKRPVLVSSASCHAVSGKYIFADRVLLKSLGGEYLHFAVLHLFFGNYTLNSAVMIYMGM